MFHSSLTSESKTGIGWQLYYLGDAGRTSLRTLYSASDVEVYAHNLHTINSESDALCFDERVRLPVLSSGHLSVYRGAIRGPCLFASRFALANSND